MKTFSTIVVAFWSLTLTISVSAQSNNEYNFEQMSVVDNDRYSTDDPATILTMDCLAANGYGQWTASSNVGPFSTNFPSPGWFLLGNRLDKPSVRHDPQNLTAHPACIPPGIVEGGAFNGSYPTAGVKVAANLRGDVFYVWLAEDRQSFIVQGLTDNTATFDMTAGQIDISLFGIPNPSINRHVVKSPILTYSPYNSVNVATTGGHPVINNEADFRDLFDIAVDEWFLYIVWTTETNISPGNTSEVWAIAIDLDANQVAFGFPAKVSVNNGLRPTIAVDGRIRPINQQSDIVPMFDIAYITNLTNGHVVHRYWDGAAFSVSESLWKNFFDPANPEQEVPYTAPKHARILVSSVHNQPLLKRAVYVIENDNHLILYQGCPGSFFACSTFAATYVDGSRALGYPAPIPLPPPNSGYDVVDQHITAFADPYRRMITPTSFKGFHCLYQLSVTEPPFPNPLMIVRLDLGSAWGINDTRLVVNQTAAGGLMADPQSFVGAMNQMGIHVHWRTGNTHFYSRDLNRIFDEQIDENTLLTNKCIARLQDYYESPFSNGPIVVNDAQVTIWTDPNYGASDTDPNSGLYLQPLYGDHSPETIGQLHLDACDFILGDEDPHNESSETDPIIGWGHIRFAPNSRLFIDEGRRLKAFCFSGITFYGVDRRVSSFNPEENPSAMIDLEGFPAEGSGGNYWFAFLGIEPGAFMRIPPYTELRSDACRISFAFGPSLTPLNTMGAANPMATGFMHNLGLLNFTCSGGYRNGGTAPRQWCNVVVGNIPPGVREKIIQCDFNGKEVPGGGGLVDASLSGIISTRNDYINEGGGLAVIQLNNLNNEELIVGNANFDEGTITAFNFDIFNQNSGVTFRDNFLIEGLSQKTIRIEQKDPLTGGLGVQIDNNTFLGKLGNSTSGIPIYIKNYNASGQEDIVMVSDNTFTYPDNDASSMVTAIHFENTTGSIIGNIITDDAFLYGIVNISTPVDGITPLTHTFMCSNEIANLHGTDVEINPGVGIITNNCHGSIRLSNIYECGWGLWSGTNDFLSLIYSDIMSCDQSGILTTSPSSTVFLSFHSPTSGIDIAGFNTITTNGQDNSLNYPQIQLADQSIIDLADNLKTWTWTNFGENNILGSDPLVISTSTPSASALLGSLDRNYWGGATVSPANGDGGPGDGLWMTGSTAVFTENVTYSTIAPNTRTSPITPSSSIDCSSGAVWDLKQGGQQPTSFTDPLDDSCKLRLNRSRSYASWKLWQLAYDTGKYYIESCYAQDESFHAFSSITAGVNSYPIDDTMRFIRHREWLLSVLYLNTTNPQYYCADVLAIMSTFLYGEHKGWRSSMAVLKYLLDNPNCNNHGLQQMWDDTWRSLRDEWAQGDTSVPFNDSLPSLDDIGLGILLTHGDVSNSGMQRSDDLLAFTAGKNPFSDGTTLNFELKRKTHIRIEIFDELGRTLGEPLASQVFDGGKHEVALSGKGLPTGAVYARLQSGHGEIRTVKLLHIK